ncbi:hypothetical protein IAD21_00541 [Abditibacteriota bacterium]|nr:hypothetical protein IAD21_00541 [Abditibacteriota bacterium]
MPNYISIDSPSGRYNHEFFDQGDGTYITDVLTDPSLGGGAYYISSDGSYPYMLTFGDLAVNGGIVLATASAITGPWLDNSTYTTFTMQESVAEVTLASLSAQIADFRSYVESYIPGIDYKVSNIEGGVNNLAASVGNVPQSVADYFANNDPIIARVTQLSDPALNAIADALGGPLQPLNDDVQLVYTTVQAVSAAQTALATAVAAIQNNTSTRLVVPPLLELPDSGNATFEIDLLIYDETGNMEAPDSLPSITVRNSAGVSRNANLSAVTLVSTGKYKATYTLAAAATVEQLIFEASVTEGGASRAVISSANIVNADITNTAALVAGMSADYARRTDVPSAVQNAASTRINLAAELAAVLAQRAVYTDARAAYLDKLNIGGGNALAHTGNADTFKATGFATTADLATVDTHVAGIVNLVNALHNLGPSDIPSANSIASAVLTLPNGVETGLTVRHVLQIAFAVLAGDTTGANTAHPKYRDHADLKDRVAATIDADGNRINTLSLD